jgi:hypothetical protein
MTSSPPPDIRTPNEKAIELMNLIPLNSYWHQVKTVNNEKNKILSYSDLGKSNDPEIYTEHEYYNVYSYSSDRSGFIHNRCVEIKYGKDSWRIYPNGSLYDFSIKNCKEITKDEFERIENNMIKAFCRIQSFGGKLILLDQDNSDWPINEEWDKLVEEHPNTVFIRKKLVPYSELKVGDKYIYFVTDNATRMGEILGIKDEKNFTIMDRQVTIDQKSEKIISESPDERDLFVLISELKESRLERSNSNKFWVITDDEWKKINFIFDEMKIEMNKHMNCDLENEEECINFQRNSRIENSEKIIS